MDAIPDDIEPNHKNDSDDELSNRDLDPFYDEDDYFVDADSDYENDAVEMK